MLHGGAQFPHIAGPGVTHQRFERVRGEFVHIFVVLGCEFLQKHPRQQRDVPRPIPQWRQRDLHHRQTEVEVLPEFAGLDLLLQILVCRRDQSHVGRQRLVGPHPLEGALSQKTQQFDLKSLIDLADLIQKQRPALRLLESSDPPLVRPGERPLFVPEKFALQQRRRQRRAMHRHHRQMCARAQLVDRLRDQFLARPAFPQQQHRGPRRRHLPDHIENLPHGGRFPHDVVQPEFGFQLLAQRHILGLQMPPPQSPANSHLQLVDLQPPFGDVIVRAALHRVHRQFLRAVGGHQDAHRRLGQGLCPRDQFHPVLLRQPEIRQ